MPDTVVVALTRENFYKSRAEVNAQVGKELVRPSGVGLTKRNGLTVNSDLMFRRPETGFITWGETPCSLSVRKRDTEPILLRQGVGDTKNPRSEHPTYTDFLLTTYQTGWTEKSQVVETFGEPYLYFFGKQIQTIRCDGWLVNTIDFPWLHEWIWNYNNVLRGSQLAAADARAYLQIGMDVYEGYLVASDFSATASDEFKVPFNFTMYVTQHISIAEQSFDTWSKYIDPEIVDPDFHMTRRLSDKQIQEIKSLGRSGRPAQQTQADKARALSAKLGRTVLKESWELLKDPSRLKQLGTAAGWKATLTKYGVIMGADVLGGITTMSPTAGAVIGDLANVAVKVSMHPDKWGTTLHRMGGGYGSDVLNALSMGRSGFDSGGSMAVGQFASSAQPTTGAPGPLQSEILPKSWGR